MKIDLKEIAIRDLVVGYQDNDENGVTGYSGKLDIRPPFQREFIYKDKQRDAVIDTVIKGFPLNVMYWAVREDSNYEIIDGQQRTISICQYVEGDFSVRVGNIPENRAFHNLQKNEQEQILNYKLMVYMCSGNDIEKLEWFKTINIAGEELTDQELKNAVFSGSWVTDAKRYFSKNSRPKIGDDYLSGSANRQEYLETAIRWISDDKIQDYMSKNQHEPNANELWLYFQSVINWTKSTFPTYYKPMKGVEWGFLYNQYKSKKLDSAKLDKEVSKLMKDDEVENKKGIFEYVLSHKEKHLNLRAFSENQRIEVYEKQKGICPLCKGEDKNKKWAINEMEADHITPWHEGGKTIPSNCQMLCKEDNRRKSGK